MKFFADKALLSAHNRNHIKTYAKILNKVSEASYVPYHRCTNQHSSNIQALLSKQIPYYYEDRNIYFDKEKGRYTDDEYGAPITVGDNCWICSNVTIVGGVTIGSGCVIGAGSVVIRDIPDNSFAAGNPCRVIRQINEQDRENYKKMKQ